MSTYTTALAAATAAANNGMHALLTMDRPAAIAFAINKTADDNADLLGDHTPAEVFAAAIDSGISDTDFMLLISEEPDRLATLSFSTFDRANTPSRRAERDAIAADKAAEKAVADSITWTRRRVDGDLEYTTTVDGDTVTIRRVLGTGVRYGGSRGWIIGAAADRFKEVSRTGWVWPTLVAAKAAVAKAAEAAPR